MIRTIWSAEPQLLSCSTLMCPTTDLRPVCVLSGSPAIGLDELSDQLRIAVVEGVRARHGNYVEVRHHGQTGALAIRTSGSRNPAITSVEQQDAEDVPASGSESSP